MKKKRALYILFLLSLVILESPGFTQPSFPVLVFDEKINKQGQSDIENLLPRRFRSTAFCLTGFFNGLRFKALRISGSGQFTQKQLTQIVLSILQQQKIPPQDFVLVDLRQEPHLFVEGKPFTLFSPYFSGHQDNTSNQSLEEEQYLKKRLEAEDTFLVHTVSKKDPKGNLGTTRLTSLSSKTILTEHEIAKDLGISYRRLAVQDHQPPSDNVVEDFITLVQNLPPQAWVHFHCRGGSGRTSTFMIMYDILKNGKKLSLSEIMNRQVALGGKNLDNITSKSPFLKEGAQKRQRFIHHFYRYATASDGLGHQSWRQWLQNNPIPD